MLKKILIIGLMLIPLGGCGSGGLPSMFTSGQDQDGQDFVDNDSLEERAHKREEAEERLPYDTNPNITDITAEKGRYTQDKEKVAEVIALHPGYQLNSVSITGEELHATVSRVDDTGVDPSELIQALQNALPRYIVNVEMVGSTPASKQITGHFS
ncbi:hypothetical protein [Jeotgalibacillus soli]|uniref:Sporulation protein n=1 Tax=Jeotgalibacillus soli TaxID=889306 RepID=A0A0C2VLF8_9BACL|nr:hypothetical protein [Jeotgalibacillus soli]KIL49752.1 hypothetical protein KP78_12200 [Jeotgalibacillus soli]